MSFQTIPRATFVVVAACALAVATLVGSSRSGHHSLHRAASTRSTVTGVVQGMTDTSVRLTTKDGGERGYELSGLAQSPATLAQLQAAARFHLQARLEVERVGDAERVRSVVGLNEGATRTFDSLKYDGMDTAPPMKLPRGLSADDVPVARVRVYNAKAMALIHAAVVDGKQGKELAKLSGLPVIDADARTLTLEDVQSIQVGVSLRVLRSRFGAPGLESTDQANHRHCVYWARSDVKDLMSGACLDAADRVAELVPGVSVPGTQVAPPHKGQWDDGADTVPAGREVTTR